MRETHPDAADVHARSMVIDAHADIVVAGHEGPYVGEDGRSKVAPDKLAAGGVDAVVLAIAVGPGPRADHAYAKARRQADRKLHTVAEMVADPANDLVLARTSADIDDAKSDGKRAIVLGFQNTQIIGTDLDALAAFHAAGTRIYALTHIGHTECADSSRLNFDATTGEREPTELHGGLSALGREALGLITAMGGLVDVSQLSRDACLQTLDLLDKPVIASHSNVKALCDVSRNLSDEEIGRIAAGGGVIHVSPFRAYLWDSADEQLVADIRSTRAAAGLPEEGLYPYELYWEMTDLAAQQAFLEAITALLGPGNLDDMIDHVDYLVDRVGVEHVGIGTDFNHGAGMPGFNEAHHAPNVTNALLLRGYDEGAIDKIWGRNFLRVLDAAQAV